MAKQQGNILEYDICPYCGQKVLKGAMRCLQCGKIQKTPEEQLASIQMLKESKKSFDTKKLLKFILFIFAVSIIYYFFSEEIIEIIRKILAD